MEIPCQYQDEWAENWLKAQGVEPQAGEDGGWDWMDQNFSERFIDILYCRMQEDYQGHLVDGAIAAAESQELI